MFIELHMIQNFSPSNLNRDDTNNPKDCEFGGTRRARISSQCIKRAIRTAPEFARTTQVPNAARTRRVIDRLTRCLTETGKDPAEVEAVLKLFVPIHLSKLDSRNPSLTAVLLYLSEDEVRTIQGALNERWAELLDPQGGPKVTKAISRQLTKAFKSHTSAPDVALFGRMLAERPVLNLEAACQVAHAISTHRVTMEMDFFTALDDLQPQEEPGAGMMGFTGYDSACFYRYARIDWRQLLANLDDDGDLARRTVEGFLRAAIAALPTGKQNSFAALNPPSFVLALVRRDGMGWSLANAFEKPVRPRGDGGLVAPSVAALDAYWARLSQVYGTNDHLCTVALCLDGDLPLEYLGDALVEDLEGWLDAVLAALSEEAKE